MRAPSAPKALAGHTRVFETRPLDFLLQQHEELGDVFAGRLYGTPTIFCGGDTGPTALFRTERANLVVHNTSVTRELFGRAVFNLRSEEHLRARRVLLSGLVGVPLRDCMPAAIQLSKTHVGHWLKGEFELYGAVRSLTMDACAKIVLGLRDDDPDYKALPGLFNTFVRGTEVRSSRRHTSVSFWRARRAASDLHELFDRRITVARQGRKFDVLSHMVAYLERNALDLVDLSDHLLAMLMATRETTASLITWLLVELSRADPVAGAIEQEAQYLLSHPCFLTRRDVAPILHSALLETEKAAFSQHD